jgi:hypothetical protein
MKAATACKFCHQPLVLELDDAYAQFRDPYQLLAFACCDTCAGLREQRRHLEGAIQSVCLSLAQFRGKIPSEVAGRAQAALERLTQRYCRLMAEWHHASGSVWEAGLVRRLLDRPEHWAAVLKGCWEQFAARRAEPRPRQELKPRP